MKAAAFSAIFVLICSCTTQPYQHEKKISEMEPTLIETDERLVQDCLYLGSVTGTTDFGKMFNLFAKSRCKKEARRQAATLGATHIVWLYAYRTSASALAYKCREQEQIR
jgi:hypothetical protein